jgi:hypothetical protein
MKKIVLLAVTNIYYHNFHIINITFIGQPYYNLKLIHYLYTESSKNFEIGERGIINWGEFMYTNRLKFSLCCIHKGESLLPNPSTNLVSDKERSYICTELGQPLPWCWFLR